MDGMMLSSKTEFAEQKGGWLKTFNIAYIIVFAIIFLMALSKDMEIGVAFFGSLVCCGAVFLVKQKVAKMKRYDIAGAVFALNGERTTEEIGQRVAVLLLQENIETIIAGDSLIFKGKNASYTFLRSGNRQAFSLDWNYSVGKIFSPMRWQFITDYRELLEETGTIAYYIQQYREAENENVASWGN